jgi:ribosomal protein L11 methyltransferase
VSPSWLQISLKAPPPALDTISNFLIERGSPGVVLEGDTVRAFFPDAARGRPLRRDIRCFLKEIAEIYPGVGGQSLRWSVLRDKNWNASWRKFFSPQKIGRGLWITPPWLKPPSPSGRKVITIEPGMAFGTGTHPTTRGCLEFLEVATSAMRAQRIAALDVGTGSGILAIALAKMGVKKVLALDSDPVALTVAKTNIRRNRVGKAVVLSDSSVEKIRGSFSIVVANLTAETLLDLGRSLQKRVRPSGYMILSGILNPKVPAVLKILTSYGLLLLRQKNEKGWSTLLLQKKR